MGFACCRRWALCGGSPPVEVADRWVLISLVEKQIDALAACEKLSPEEAKVKLLREKQPSLEFTTPEQLGALGAFLCSDAAAQLNGVALPVDGGWTARRPEAEGGVRR